jgi:hypothetical protein
MPSFTIWMLRCSLVYLVLTAISGSILLLNKAWQWNDSFWMLFPIHIGSALFGWLFSFVIAVAYWIFPRFQEGALRGSERAGRIMFMMTQGGILLMIAPVQSWQLAVTGRGMLLAGTFLFAVLIWKRIVSYRSDDVGSAN